MVTSTSGERFAARKMGFLNRKRGLKTGMTTLLASSLVYVLLCLVGFHWYQHQVNPDGIAYVSIAQHFLHGHIHEAINAYWSPLLSLLTVPFLALGKEPIATIKFVMVLCGLANMLLVSALSYQLLRTVKLRFEASLIVGSLAALVAAAWALAGPTTPDLLYSAIFLALMLCVLRQKTAWQWYVLVGLLCGLLFLAKAVGLLVAVVILFCILFAKVRQGSGWQKSLIAPLVMLAVISPYILAISAKYGRPMLGSSSNYNLQLIAPETKGHPMLTQLLPPPHQYATTVWEDITPVPVGNWNPLATPYDLGFFAINAGRNAWQTVLLAQAASWLCVPFVLAIAWLWARRWRQRKTDKKVHVVDPWPLITIGAATLASLLPYIFLFTEERYVYHALLLALVGFGVVLAHWMDEHGMSRNFALIMLGIFALSWTIHPAQQLWQNRRIDAAYYTDSQSFAGKIPAGSRVASSTFASLYFCFYTNTRCYSTLPADTAQAVKQIQQYNIDYLLLYPPDLERLKPYLKLQAVGSATYFDMRLYQIR